MEQTTLPVYIQAVSDVDKVLAEINAKQAQNGKMGVSAMDVMQDISLIIQGGIAILKGVKILVWWKPSWKTTIDNVITWMETFLVPDVATVSAVAPVAEPGA